MDHRVREREWERAIGKLKEAFHPLGFCFEGENPTAVRFFYEGEAVLRIALKEEENVAFLGFLALQILGKKKEVEDHLTNLPPLEGGFGEKASLLRLSRPKEGEEAVGSVWAVFSLPPEEVDPERVLALAKLTAEWSLRVKERFVRKKALLLSPLSPLLVSASG